MGAERGCAPSLWEAQKLKHIWTKITLNVPKLQQLCINILLLTIILGGRWDGSFPPVPPPQVDRTLKVFKLC